MTIRQKVGVLVASLFGILILAQIFIQERVIMPSFAELERADARTSMTRIHYAFERALEGMELTASDWADWGELYHFMQDLNPAFVATYTSPAALAPLKINLLMLIDHDGHVVLTTARTLESSQDMSLDLATLQSLPRDFPWARHLDSGKAARGLIRTDKGVMLLVAAPILDGSGGGTPRGLALMGRLLTADQIGLLGTEAQAALTLLDEARAPTAPSLTETNDLTYVFRTYDDIYGHPLMTLRVAVPRDITARGQAAVKYSLGYLVSAAVTVLLLLLVLLDRVVLQPIARLTRHAVTVGDGGDLAARLDFRGHDELSQLAREFDRMVARLAESRREWVDRSYEAGLAELAKGLMHNLGNAMTPLGVRLALLSGRLHDVPLDDVAAAARELSDPRVSTDRRADLTQFVALGAGEIQAAFSAARGDLAVMERQAAIVTATLADQMPNSRNEPVVEAVALPDLVTQTLDIVPDVARRRLSIELDDSLRKAGTITLPRTVLRLVLQNLIINSADAIGQTGRESGTLRITARLEPGTHGGDNLHLECQDDGIGIAPEHLTRVFEKGFSTKSRHTNHGIGLHWCANAVHALGGRIWATSDGRGHGTRMHVIMPVSGHDGAHARRAA